VFAAEFGFEVASSNAAFILRRKGKALLLPWEARQQQLPAQLPSMPSFRTVLQLRQLSLAAHSSHTDAFVAIGNLFYHLAKAKKKKQALAVAVAVAKQRTEASKGWSRFALQRVLVSYLPVALVGVSTTEAGTPAAGGTECLANSEDGDEGGHGSSDSNFDDDTDDALSAAHSGWCTAVPDHECVHRYAAASVWWYSKASAAGSSLGSMYTGMMTQLGIGVPRASSWRAERYYRAALQQDAAGSPLQPQLKSLTKLLLWSSTVRDGHSLAWLTQPIERVIKYMYS
jgi:hypothetical protein